MSRETLTITMPPNMIAWARRQAEMGGHSSVSAYFRKLLQNEARYQRNLASAREAVDAVREMRKNGAPRRVRRSRRGQS